MYACLSPCVGSTHNHTTTHCTTYRTPHYWTVSCYQGKYQHLCHYINMCAGVVFTPCSNALSEMNPMDFLQPPSTEGVVTELEASSSQVQADSQPAESAKSTQTRKRDHGLLDELHPGTVDGKRCRQKRIHFSWLVLLHIHFSCFRILATILTIMIFH